MSNNSSPDLFVCTTILILCRSQWPRGLRRRSTASRLLSLWVRIPEKWILVCCECCLLSGRGLGVKLITCLEESYRLWCVQWVWTGNLKNEEAMVSVGLQRHRKKKKPHFFPHKPTTIQTFILSCDRPSYSILIYKSVSYVVIHLPKLIPPSDHL